MIRHGLIFLSILLLLTLPIRSTGQDLSDASEIRYSFDLDAGDTFEWTIDDYLDDGREVTQEQGHFGRIVDDTTVKMTVIASPTLVNIVDETNLDYMLDTFRITVGRTAISQASNIGIIQYFIYPTLIIFEPTDEKHFVTWNFKNSFDGTVFTNGDNFEVTIEDYSGFIVDSDEMTINLLNIVYDRNSGVMQSMRLLANTTDSDIELQVDVKQPKSDDSILSVNTPFLYFSLILMIVIVKRLKIKQDI